MRSPRRSTRHSFILSNFAPRCASVSLRYSSKKMERSSRNAFPTDDIANKRATCKSEPSDDGQRGEEKAGPDGNAAKEIEQTGAAAESTPSPNAENAVALHPVHRVPRAPAGFSPPQLDKEHHGDVNPAPVEQSPRYNEITEWFLDRHKASLSRGSVHGRLASGPHGNYGGRLFLSAVPLCEDDGTFIISGSHPLDAPVPRVADVWDCPPDRMARQVVGLVPPYQATPRGMSRRRLEGGLEIPCRNRKPIRRPRNAFA